MWHKKSEFNRLCLTVALDYSQYKSRVIPTKTSVIKIGDSIYVNEDDGYIKYEKSKEKEISYLDILEKAKEK